MKPIRKGQYEDFVGFSGCLTLILSPLLGGAVWAFWGIGWGLLLVALLVVTWVLVGVLLAPPD